MRINSSRVLIVCKDVQLKGISFVFYCFAFGTHKIHTPSLDGQIFLNLAICRYTGSRIIARICKVLSGKTCTVQVTREDVKLL